MSAAGGRKRARSAAKRAPAGVAARRERILEAGRALFLRQGYAAVSMDEVAAEADVSKQTLYNHFASKQALFEATIGERCAAMVAVLQEPAAADEAPAAVLRALGLRVLERIYTGPALLLFRTVVAEVGRQPELGALYYRSGPAQALAALTRWFAEQKRRGRMRIDDPDVAAEHFYALLGGTLRTRALLGVEQGLSPARIRDHVDAAVRAFLRAYPER